MNARVELEVGRMPTLFLNVMLYRRPAQLAVQASLLLALEPEGCLYRVGDLADTLGVGAPYLAKVLQSLTRAGVLRAVRGPGGGVQFARSPREIHLWDILSAVEPANEFERCFLGLKPCSDLNRCPLHEDWAPIRAEIHRLLQTKNLWEFAAEARTRGVLYREPASRNASGQESPCAEGQP